jgi:hypothetical protein
LSSKQFYSKACKKLHQPLDFHFHLVPLTKFIQVLNKELMFIFPLSLRVERRIKDFQL